MGLLGVSDAPYRLEQTDVDTAVQLISGRAGCRLPIVYASSSFDAGDPLDTGRLASDLAGNGTCSRRTKPSVLAAPED